MFYIEFFGCHILERTSFHGFFLSGFALRSEESFHFRLTVFRFFAVRARVGTAFGPLGKWASQRSALLSLPAHAAKADAAIAPCERVRNTPLACPSKRTRTGFS